MEIMPIFPSPLAKFKLNRKFTDIEKEIIQKQQTHSFNAVEQTINRFVLDNKELYDIKKFICRCVDNFRQQVLLASPEIDLKITQSWINFFNSNSLHAHTHPNSLISGVLYISANPEVDNLLFIKHQNDQLEFNVHGYNLYNSKSWSVPVSTGDCILFPSNLIHAVDNSSNKNRKSLAFNTFPRGILGSSESTNFIDFRDNCD